MRSLVFLEHHGGALEKGGLGVLSKAASLGEAVGRGARATAPPVWRREPARTAPSKAYACEAPELAAPLPQPRVDALATLVEQTGADAVLFGASVLAADVAVGSRGAPRRGSQLGPDRPRDRRRRARRQAARARRHGARRRRLEGRAQARSRPLGRVRPRRVGRVGRGRDVRARRSPTSRRSRRSSSRRRRSRAGRRSRRRTSSSPAVAGSARRRASRCWRSSRLRSAARSPRRARSSTPAGTRTRRRSARPGRPCRRSSTSPAASRGRSSTRSGCRASGTIVAINKDPERADLRLLRHRRRRRPAPDRPEADGARALARLS